VSGFAEKTPSSRGCVQIFVSVNTTRAWRVPVSSRRACVGFVAASGSTNMTGNYIDKGVAVDESGNYTGAIVSYDKALAIDLSCSCIN
jgi:hypothetical protein